MSSSKEEVNLLGEVKPLITDIVESPSETQQVLAHFRDNYAPRTRGGKTLTAPIKARLNEGYTVGDLIQVIERAQIDPWHIKTTKCLDIKYLMRGDIVARFLAGTDEQRHRAARLDPKTVQNMLVAEAFLQKGDHDEEL